MPTTGYLIAAIAIAGVITLALRVVPFVVLKPLRRSRFVQALGRWMPVGIMLILAVVVLRDEVVKRPENWWAVAVAAAVTVLVHLLGKRRALLSIAAGTTCYILLLNVF